MTDNLLTSEEATKVIRAMGELFPEAKAELNHDSPFQLLIAVILSAQTTDVGVNKVTPDLFAAYPTPEDLMQADLDDIMEKIKTIGLYRNKAKFIKSCATDIVERFGGEVPQTRKELQSLAGVGRKTANVVMSVAFAEPAIAVDTHVNRISKKFNIAPEDASIRQVENCLMEKLPKDLWSQAHHWLIFFGRYQCPARDHDHDECVRKVYDIVETM
ncbi:endonuclease III [Dolosigranulum savutiense]|uniref:Endonuclease III n=1 Tax=Dolosigranulum savutiense TaxID=3110288 RepID=A0AB74TZL2_9LACT